MLLDMWLRAQGVKVSDQGISRSALAGPLVYCCVTVASEVVNGVNGVNVPVPRQDLQAIGHVPPRHALLTTPLWLSCGSRARNASGSCTQQACLMVSLVLKRSVPPFLIFHSIKISLRSTRQS